MKPFRFPAGLISGCRAWSALTRSGRSADGRVELLRAAESGPDGVRELIVRDGRTVPRVMA
ncbi:hypothetical protein ABT224_11085 [Streptomyces sp. NPDC001584]|uniref:hypothetical protein n=1 Tax=Streptomyces sp. NPDC001584 TaxID=3154521 RepID=UPI003323836A